MIFICYFLRLHIADFDGDGVLKIKNKGQRIMRGSIDLWLM